ncbi:chemotaxis protein CheE [uncultured Brevundimonas sp.]|uniref:chemotaxis protein CheE n=1 Tax=uncultured Brevundimonas sp. TaxID=213418 RepID=UPI0025CB9EEE|nr:chemotaxis protein CheE [uncultured Brevundimonas sp.]
MTVITHARRKSNLSQMIDKPGGVSIGVALTQARANIEAKRAEAAGVVDAQIAALEAIAAPTSPAELSVRLEEVYHAANAVIDAASPFELDDLCKGAAGLCDVIDAAQPGQPFDWRIVTVHARSLRLLQTLPVEEIDARNQVLESLRQILLRKVAPKA